MFDATPTNDPDYRNLEDALESISQLSATVLKGNVKAGTVLVSLFIRTAEMAQVMDVQKRLSGYEENLVEQDRSLIREAPLMLVQQASLLLFR